MPSFSRSKMIWILIGFLVFDALLPIPLLSVFALYVVVKRPVWFLDRVRQLYAAR